MGKALKVNRGGAREAGFAYTVSQYQLARNAEQALGSALSNVSVYQSVSVDPATGVITGVNLYASNVTIGNTTNYSSLTQYIGKYAVAPGLKSCSCITGFQGWHQSADYSDPAVYQPKVQGVYASLSRLKIVLSDTDPGYTTDTPVGGEVRKNV